MSDSDTFLECPCCFIRYIGESGESLCFYCQEYFPLIKEGDKKERLERVLSVLDGVSMHRTPDVLRLMYEVLKEGD